MCLFDIGVTGPLAGMVVAIPVLLLGLSLSHLDVIKPLGGMVEMEGNSLLYLAAKYLTFGQLLPAPGLAERSLPIHVLASLLLHGPSNTHRRDRRDHPSRGLRRLGRACWSRHST